MERKIISQLELQVIMLKDLDNLADKDCAKEMGMTKSEYRKILKATRKKLTSAICENSEILICKEPEVIEEICSTKCKFRCATCSKIYEIDYTRECITCPLCGSNKVMKIEEAGDI